MKNEINNGDNDKACKVGNSCKFLLLLHIDSLFYGDVYVNFLSVAAGRVVRRGSHRLQNCQLQVKFHPDSEDEDNEYEQERHDGVSILRGLVRMMNTYFLYPFQKLSVAKIK